jgi:hypothetical protein
VRDTHFYSSKNLSGPLILRVPYPLYMPAPKLPQQLLTRLILETKLGNPNELVVLNSSNNLVLRSGRVVYKISGLDDDERFRERICWLRNNTPNNNHLYAKIADGLFSFVFRKTMVMELFEGS